MNPLTKYREHKLPVSFFRHHNVCLVARRLLGKYLVTCFEGNLTAGRIVETEAYAGHTDRASHAWNGRFTERTAVMYEPGGLAYVYLCYGIHHLFNVVTHEAGTPHAVLIRGIEPVAGHDVMLARMQKKQMDISIGRGPGNVSKALGIMVRHTQTDLQSDVLFLADGGSTIRSDDILVTPRIGVDYAGEDALLPYRFCLKGHPQVSGKKTMR